jgi:hypothetical protein
MLTLTRRTFWLSALTLPLVARHATAATGKAPRRNVLSMGMRSAEMRMVTVSEPSTYLMSVTLEAPFEAIRIGLANITPVPYSVEGICVAEAAPGTPWKPAADAAWAYFGFGGYGSADILPPPSGPQPCIVRGNERAVTGALNVPAIVWSDWIAYRTRERSGRPQILLRALIPPQFLPMAFPVGPGGVKESLAGQGRRVIGQGRVAGDFVTRPQDGPARWEPVPYAPVCIIQYKTNAPGVQMVMGGDSHLSGWFNFVQLAAWRLSTPDLPISLWNTAWGGQPSNTFWPIEDDAIAAAVPSIAVIEGWTANDGMRPAADEAYLTRVREMAARAERDGAIPIILKGLPRSLFGAAELSSWQRINAQLDHLVPGALVFDPTPYVEDPQRPGDWRPGFSNDRIHPNLDGNLALAGPFERMLRSLV